MLCIWNLSLCVLRWERLDPGVCWEHNVFMRIKINSEWAEYHDGISIVELLAKLKLDSRRIAVERNTMIVRRANFESTQLSENDELEIVTLVGGG